MEIGEADETFKVLTGATSLLGMWAKDPKKALEM